MRTLLVRIDGDVEPGDIVILQCADRYRGGQSNARAHVRQLRPDRIEVVNGTKTIVEDKPELSELVAMIAREIGSRWGSGFSARQRNANEIVVQCETNSQEVNFSYTIEGSKKQRVTIEELA
jgi:hypothetical protein